MTWFGCFKLRLGHLCCWELNFNQPRSSGILLSSSQITNKYCMTCHFKIICLVYLSLRKRLFSVNILIFLLTCLAGKKKKYASHRTDSLLNKRINLVKYIRNNEGLAWIIYNELAFSYCVVFFQSSDFFPVRSSCRANMKLI